jgi:hypothetical protein
VDSSRSVKFGHGSTAGTTNIGLTKALTAANGMKIDFELIFFPTNTNKIIGETLAVASSATLTTAENAAVAALAGPGVAYFDFGHNEYFIATNNTETAVSSQ